MNEHVEDSPEPTEERTSETQEKYYDLSEAFREISTESNGKDKAVAGLKLFGKSLFNVVRYAATEMAPAMLEQLPHRILSAAEDVLGNPDSTPEERQKAEKAAEKARAAIAARDSNKQTT